MMKFQVGQRWKLPGNPTHDWFTVEGVDSLANKITIRGPHRTTPPLSIRPESWALDEFIDATSKYILDETSEVINTLSKYES
jgi:hypothetical protein